MQTRHRIPTIFNLSMVDVLCCALGCVILLWLLNLREAKQRAEAAGQFESALAKTKDDLQEREREAADIRDRLLAAEQERERLRRERDGERVRLRDQMNELAQARAAHKDAADRLSKKGEEVQALENDLAAARLRQAVDEKLLKQKQALALAAIRNADELAERLRDLDAEAKQLRAQAAAVPGLREEAQKYRERLATASLQVQTLEKEIDARKRDLNGTSKSLQELEAANAKLERELTARTSDFQEANRKVEALVKEKSTQQTTIKRAQTAEDKRFAGISLTGKRVVFLVDMSGSMELIDERTPSSNKWSGVRETLAKIMRSLPELEKIQVILFSDRVSYPLGNIEQWIDFDANTVERTTKALAEVKPSGNTNMYSAFETAFKLRSQGLDTVYLLSDGLPSVGAGLSVEDARQLKETERNDVFCKFVRKTLLSDWNRPLPDKPRVRINAVGFFYESPDIGAFLWALAREHDGSFVGMSKP